MEEKVAKLQELISSFRKEKNESENEKSTIDLMTMVEDLKNVTFDKTKDGMVLAKINSCAVTLWNLSVALKSGKKTSSLVNAKARHVACRLTFLATATEITESSWRRKLPLAIKTGKSWLDCNNNKMADESFKLAMECWSKMNMIRDSKLVDSKPNTKEQQQIHESELNVLKLYAYMAESAFAQDKDEEAKVTMDKAKSFLTQCPKQSTLLATYCYNFGVESFKKEKFEQSIIWLRESYEIGKGMDGASQTNLDVQATCLRLIAQAYLETGKKEDISLALNSIDLSISIQSNPRSLYLKLKIILCADDVNDERRLTAIQNCINHPDFKIELGLQTVKLLIKHKCNRLINKAFELLLKRFPKPHEATKIQIDQLEYLLEEKQVLAGKDLVASGLISDVKNLQQADANVLKKFHLLVWEQAAKLFEADVFIDALSWYDYSLECFANSGHESKNIAKLQRNRASCFLGMKQYEKANDAIREAYKLQADCVQTYFIHFKICLASTDDGKALVCIQKISELALEQTDSSAYHGFICLAAQMAFQDGNKKVAMAALEKIIQQAKESKQILTALRCLLRLKYTYLSPVNKSDEVKTMLGFIKKAYEVLKTSQSPEFEPEIQWFIKIAWNLGLSCQDSYKEMFSYFVLCFELSQLFPTKCNKVQQRTCLLMASAAGIETSKNATDENERMCILNDVVSYIQKCERIYHKSAQDQPQSEKTDLTLPMLICLEFEAKARLGYKNTETIIDKAKDLHSTDAKTFETIAATALEISPKHNPEGIKALKMAIKCHLEDQRTDYLQLSKDLHTLVNISINEGGNSNPQSKEEAYQYYQNILEIIQKAPKNSYPEMEILWLMTKAWNCGVHLFSAHEFEACERWCGMAMKFLDQLDTLKSNYTSHMTSVFAEILEKRERTSVRSQVEE